MDHILSAALEGLCLVFSWPNILYPLAATLAAMIFALIPGISGITLMVLAIPFTYSWDPLEVMLVFGALVGGATFMGSVTAILLNIPGTSPNAATTIDCYPLACRGQAKTAIGSSALASALGSTFGILVLIALIPVMRQAVMAFGPSEFLVLAVWGLTMIAALTRGSTLKGLVTAGLGLMLAFVGLDPRTAEMRYTFDSAYLRGGVNVIPIFIGIFAVAETMSLWVTGRRTISGRSRVEDLRGSTREGFRAVFRNLGLLVRSAVIGTVTGIIPGVGGTVASFVAYGHAVQTAGSGKENFGRGDIRGVIAPEAANDAKDGASLVPTLAFGVPGSEGTVLLLAVLLLKGLTPGRELVTQHLDLVFVLVWSLFLSNWVTSILGVLMIDWFAWITVVRLQLIGPMVFVLSCLAAFVYKGDIADVLVVVVFGVVGYYMKKHGWPRITLVVALVLGGLFETNFHIALKLHQLGRINFWARPVTLLLLALTAASFLLPYARGWWTRYRNRPSE